MCPFNRWTSLLAALFGTTLIGCGTVPGLDLMSPITRYDEAVSTSFSDAVPEAPLLDAFSPADTIPLNLAGRGPEGEYYLTEGFYQITLRSYCLNAGGYAPRRESINRYAFWQGPIAEQISQLLRASHRHPEVEQSDIQLMIWAFLARTKPSELPSDLRASAQDVLTPSDLARLEAWGMTPTADVALEAMVDRLPDELAGLFQVHEEIRRTLTSGPVRYEDIERIAVRYREDPSGPVQDSAATRRWSYHPNGFFIRLLPDGYRLITVEIFVPTETQFQYDASDRLVTIQTTDRKGHPVTLEIEYGNRVDLQDPETSLRGFSLKALRLRDYRIARAGGVELGQPENTWAFVGVPGAEESPGDPGHRDPSIAWRHSQAIALRAELEPIVPRSHRSEAGLRTAMNLGHLFQALIDNPGQPEHETANPMGHIRNLLLAAWAFETCRMNGSCQTGMSEVPTELTLSRTSKGPRFLGSPMPDGSKVRCISGPRGRVAMQAQGGCGETTFDPAAGGAEPADQEEQPVAPSSDSDQDEPSPYRDPSDADDPSLLGNTEEFVSEVESSFAGEDYVVTLDPTNPRHISAAGGLDNADFVYRHQVDHPFELPSGTRMNQSEIFLGRLGGSYFFKRTRDDGVEEIRCQTGHDGSSHIFESRLDLLGAHIARLAGMGLQDL